MLNVDADVVLADPVHLPGNVRGLARASVVEPPSAGVADELVIWRLVPAMPIVELARNALVAVPVSPSLTLPADGLAKVKVIPLVAAEFW